MDLIPIGFNQKLYLPWHISNILGLSVIGPITVKTSDDTLKIRHFAATIKFNELWINYYVLTIFRKSRQKQALHVLKHQSVTNRIRVYFKVFHSFTSYKSTQDQSVQYSKTWILTVPCSKSKTLSLVENFELDDHLMPMNIRIVLVISSLKQCSF